jgi:hypothetical protein
MHTTCRRGAIVCVWWWWVAYHGFCHSVAHTTKGGGQLVGEVGVEWSAKQQRKTKRKQGRIHPEGVEPQTSSLSRETATSPPPSSSPERRPQLKMSHRSPVSHLRSGWRSWYGNHPHPHANSNLNPNPETMIITLTHPPHPHP